MFEKGQWKRIPFEDISTTIYDTNMLIDAFPSDDIELLSLVKKESSAANGNANIRSHHKRIDPNYKSNF